MAFIFITLLIDVIGFGIVIPVLPKLVLNLSGGTASHGDHTYGLLLAVYGLMQFLFAPIFGNLSDQFGRRPVLLISLAFTGVDYVAQALAPTVTWLFMGRIIAGITGASFTAATAYIADISEPEKRAQNFGMIGTAFGLGFIIGPGLGGILSHWGPRVPFWAAAVVTLLNMLYGYFVLPESLGKENRRKFETKNLNPFRSLAILARNPWVLSLSFMLALLSLAQQVPPSTWVLYTNYRFGWQEKENGWSLALLGAATMFVQLRFIRWLSSRISDIRMMAFALLFNLIGFVFMGWAPTAVVMLAAMVVWTLCFVGGPAIMSLISEEFGPTERGATQGALTAIQSLTGVLGPILFTSVFAFFTHDGPVKVPGACFYLGAVFTVFAGVIAWFGIRARQAVTV